MKYYRIIITFFIVWISQILFSQEKEIEIPTNATTIKGTLSQPKDIKKPPLVIIIPGSGPTDRNGNNAVMTNNSLQLLAHKLNKNHIASYRYDKNALHYPKEAKIDTLTFTTFIYEAQQVIKYFKKENLFSKIIVLGHSQGSLVGMLACKNNVNGFISLAGAGESIDKIIHTQILTRAPFLAEETQNILKELKAGNTVEKVNPMLASLFSPSVQPFLISWMQYQPKQEIKKLKIPILILNGTKDLQVDVSNAEQLHQQQPTSKMVFIENMNHILKEIKGDATENMQSYNAPHLPVSEKLINTITEFVKSI